MASTRKQIAFDLDTVALKEYYPTDSWRNAYYDIRNHMEKNGFNWIQGSVYESKNPLSSIKLSKTLEDLVKNNLWLTVCMRDCKETNIGKQHSKNYIFAKKEKVLTREEMKTKASDQGMSLSDYKKKIKEEREKNSQSGNKATKEIKKGCRRKTDNYDIKFQRKELTIYQIIKETDCFPSFLPSVPAVISPLFLLRFCGGIPCNLFFRNQFFVII